MGGEVPGEKSGGRNHGEKQRRSAGRDRNLRSQAEKSRGPRPHGARAPAQGAACT